MKAVAPASGREALEGGAASKVSVAFALWAPAP